jgi:hypothetical protein
MLEVADIFRLHGPAYRQRFAARLLPSHRRAMQDIEQCRTATLGGQVYYCAHCQTERYSYHSCKNRHCPKCGNEQANQWLQAQQTLLLPIPYFLVTFTLPQELRPLARSHQKLLYNLLFRAAAQALLKLAQDPRFIGATPGMVGVLHTWTRQLLYHPHVHFIVSGGGLTPTRSWRASAAHFLIHEKPLALIFRAKLRDGLKQAGLLAHLDPQLWKKDWLIDCKPVGNGLAAFKYLAPYIFRVALSNHRLLKLQDGLVTFKYKDSASKQIRGCTIAAEEFIRRFLQHVLPPAFVKLRYYGLLSPSNRRRLAQARQLLSANATSQSAARPPAPDSGPLPLPLKPNPSLRCPHCGQPLILLAPLKPTARAP